MILRKTQANSIDIKLFLWTGLGGKIGKEI